MQQLKESPIMPDIIRFVIYKISFPNNPKVYIGKTFNYKKRLGQHRSAAKHMSQYAIHRALRKYGIKNAVFEIIATILKEEYVEEAEIAMIKQHNSFRKGYNMTPGGGGRGKKHSAETREKQSVAYHKTLSQYGNWRLYFKDGRIIECYGLRKWCRINGYDNAHVNKIYMGKLKRHKDIIKVEKIPI